REIEDQLSEKILFGEIGPGQTVYVDVEGWDGEGSGEDAKFTFTGKTKLTKADKDEGKPEVVLTGAAEGTAEAAGE
ncbi:Clp protease, partial [Nocardia sp. NPDC052316]|uniref:Clp protease n=1 Tax=Nocardia sp. NPDC052316 TaxID=3364329 RepID=UPI0037C5E787